MELCDIIISCALEYVVHLKNIMKDKFAVFRFGATVIIGAKFFLHQLIPLRLL